MLDFSQCEIDFRHALRKPLGKHLRGKGERG
jgi:hypothetical protein